MSPPPRPRTVSPIQHASQMFNDALSIGPAVMLCSVSGGKDAASCAQLAVEARKRHPGLQLGAVFWYSIPGIRCMEEPVERLCERFSMPLYKVPHVGLTLGLLAATHRAFTAETNNLPALKMVDLELAGRVRFAAHLSGIAPEKLHGPDGKLAVKLKDFAVNPFKIWMVYGHRQDESLERRGMLSGFRNQTVELGVKSGGRLGFDPKFHRIYPLASWSRPGVMAYVRHHRLPLSPTFGRKNQSEPDINDPECLRELRAKYPDDYAKVLRLFPRVAGLIDG